MFALGTFLVSKYFANVHLDSDAILYGNIEFAAQDVLFVGSSNLGPLSIWIMSALCVMNAAFVGLFYKELKLSTFDAGLAASLGFAPVVLHYALMTVVSITAVGAFTAVGAILTVALFIVPAATAYLLTDRLPVMIGLSIGVGALSAVSGYFAAETLVVHLLTHAGTPQAEEESAVAHLGEGLRWTPEFAARVIRWADRAGLIVQSNGHLGLTERGIAAARATAELRN
jgi:manganese/zinc/iron transport system permease protein